MSKVKSLSFLVPNTGASQMSFYLIHGLNNLAKSSPEIDSIIFYENRHKNCLPPNFATMEISEAWSKRDSLISCSLSCAKKMIKFPCKKKLFYVWDLEWIRNTYSLQEYENYKSVYCNENVELIARSEEHKKLIENAFNRKVKCVISDFNMKEILEVLDE
jgi:hypothetical protein